jgi:exodeoxyribonuclease V alpha subunit
MNIDSLTPSSELQLGTRLDNLLQKNRLNRIDYRTARDLLRLSGLQKDSDILLPLLLSLFLALNEGSLCLELEEEKLKKRLARFNDLGSGPETAHEILAGIRGGSWSSLISRDAGSYLPLQVHSERGRDFLYFQKYYSKEKQLADDFTALLEAPEVSLSPDRIEEILDETLRVAPVTRGGVPIELNLQQRIGVTLALLKNVVIISGGPGTGKTSIVVAFLRALARLGAPIDRIRLAAPTGRAANRMSESIRAALASISQPSGPDLDLKRLEGTTLHRLLKYRGDQKPFWYHRDNPVPADLIVIDEVSMVDVALMADLLAAILPGTRLILLGDKDQLPSVDAGAVLGNLIPGLTETCLSPEGRSLIEKLFGVAHGGSPPENARMADRVVLLDTSYRSEATILSLAGEINKGNLGALAELDTQILPTRAQPQGLAVDWPIPVEGEAGLRCPGGGFRWIDAEGKSPRYWSQLLDSWIDRQFLHSEGGVRRFLGLVKRPAPPSVQADSETFDRLTELFSWLDRSRILCLVRKGPFGVEWVNRHVGNRMREQTIPGYRSELYPGLPILILQNDPALGLFNGDVGILLSTGDRSLRAHFTRHDAFVSFPISSLPHFEPAYAITVHKSQGSEYDQILLVLTDDPDHLLLTREIVYTGMTRAKNLVVLYGKEECLRVATGRKIQRESGRNLWNSEVQGF